MTVDERLIGGWKLLSFAFLDEAGEAFLPIGENPVGQVLFTADGHMSLCFADPARPAFADNDLFAGSVDELAAAAAGAVAFGGPCRTEDGAVIVDVGFSLFPNWVGGVQRRLYEVDGDQLTLKTRGTALFGGRERRGQAKLARYDR